jgi:hypothetical protein
LEDTVLNLIFFIGRLLDSWDDELYADDPLATPLSS